MKRSFGYPRFDGGRRTATGSFPKILSWVLIFSLAMPVYSTSFARASEGGREGGLCEHHPEHTAECGYTPGTEGTPCNHVHDEACGYTEPVEGAPCGHVHDDACGYTPGVEPVPCDKGCEDTDGDGEVDHSPDCAYRPGEEGTPCNHVHDEICGYKEPVEGTPCGHVHDEACGYTPGEPGSPCTFVCEVCSAQESGTESGPVSVLVSSWEWADEDAAPQWNEDAGCYGLGIPGVGEEMPLTAEMLQELLPAAVDALLEDGSGRVLELTWDMSAFPEEGAYEGEYSLTAALPEGYGMAEDARPLTVLISLGEGSGYSGAGRERVVQNVPNGPNENDSRIHKFVSNWHYVPVGSTQTITERGYQYFLELNMVIPEDQRALARRLRASLPQRIECSGYNGGDNNLVNAGFTPQPGSPATGTLTGYVGLTWNIESVLAAAKTVKDGDTLTFEATPNSGFGYLLRVNTNDSTFTDSAGWEADTAETDGILNLTVTLHVLSLEGHTVHSVNPPATTVNLFDYWVDQNGAEGDDMLSKSEYHDNTANQPTERTGRDDWNHGINLGRLLLFGDGNIHAGFWNKGAGAGGAYGKKYAGMEGIVQKLLVDGYPVINTGALTDSLTDYALIDDYMLCGDHDPDGGTGRTSLNAQNVSNKVIEAWEEAGSDPSLAYLFNPAVENDYKVSHTGVEGLFQLDDYGYYYYDMRLNYAAYDEDSNRFVLYDAPAVDRTDGIYDAGSGNWLTQRSTGNFFPFNRAEEVFTGISDENTLESDASIQSDNRKGAAWCNHHMGMTVSVDFRQPSGGMISTGAAGRVPMTFQFSGDDDIWVFIDDVLVLDLGGIHSEIYGSINFATGNVSVGQSWKTNGFPYNANGVVNSAELERNAVHTYKLQEIFHNAGVEDQFGWNNGTFASDSNHTLKVFYLERGNYDSSLALRFNLQPQLYQSIKKVDQDGNPISGIQFELYPAEETAQGTDGAILCQYTDSDVNGKRPFYVRKKDGSAALATLTTGEDGTVQFEQGGNPLSFADMEDQFFILKEVSPPDGYRALPVDLVLHYNRDTSMLTVSNRWTTGAYACSVSHVMGTGRLTYGSFDPATGNITAGANTVDRTKQEDGLALAIPMLLQKQKNTWEGLYGSNLSGFKASEVPQNATADQWRTAVLKAALEQSAGSNNPHWYLSWGGDWLSGTLSDLPGLASRYQVNNPNGDMRMVYGIIEPAALERLGIRGADAAARYEALGEYVRKNGSDKTAADIMAVEVAGTGSGKGFSFLNAGQFNRTFRSLIYIPNEQRELWVVKVDQEGVPRNGVQFGLYSDQACKNLVASGTTGKVDGQDGLLIFSPRDDSSAGHAKVVWASLGRTHYYLKETRAPAGLNLNQTVIPVVVGTYSIYVDAGTADDGISVMAGVGNLTQTMHQYASEGKVDITLRDITAYGQYQPSENTSVPPELWQDMELKTTLQDAVLRSMDLHYHLNAIGDYGLHDVDGGKLYKPFFITDSGFIRARVEQNYPALIGANDKYDPVDANTNKDDLTGVDITNLFSLLNVVVVTDRITERVDTGELVIGKTVTGSEDEEDYRKNFSFKVELTGADGAPLSGSYYFWGRDKSGQLQNGDTLVLRHDDEITVQGLPVGTRFTVTETSENGWFTYPENGVVSGAIEKGSVVPALFINSREPIDPPAAQTGALTLLKTVTGSGGDQDKEFTFTLTLTGADGAPLAESFSYRGSKSGEIRSGGTVALKHGESITIWGLPLGTEYTVTESDGDGYTVTKTGDTGRIQTGTAIAEFENHKDSKRPHRPSDPKDPDDPPPKLPDPNDPDTPDRITVEEEDGPKTYVKVWDPEEEEWIWVPEDEVPLKGNPPTGNSRKQGLWLFFGTALLAGFAVAEPSALRRSRARGGMPPEVPDRKD